MPSIASRNVDISSTHIKSEPGGGQAPMPIAMPTPHLPWLGRNPRMISSLPLIYSTPDSALRQFYGGSIPGRRVSNT